MTATPDAVIAYHERTKHHFHRFAASLGYMDWANQPDPFRRYNGAPKMLLPFVEPDDSPPYDALYGEEVRARSLNIHSIGALFEHSLAISAWKEYRGTRWALRCNPSSGNLHPTEGYLVCGPVDGLCDGPALFHYGSLDHSLERRVEFAAFAWESLTNGFPKDTFFIGLTSIHWREAWKYGERAYRYCQHDAGHAMAAVSYAASALGWKTAYLEGLDDEAVARLLGIYDAQPTPEVEWERPDCVLALFPPDIEATLPMTLPEDMILEISNDNWHGAPNTLSAEHVEWEAMDAVTAACVKPATEHEARKIRTCSNGSGAEQRSNQTAFELFKQRRSALAMDGQTAIAREDFFTALQRTMPVAGRAPCDVLAPPAEVHLAVFVHRVTDLTPGLYILVRNGGHLGDLRDAMHSRFRWDRVEEAPQDLPLYLLDPGDYRRRAMQISCGQDIASDGAFAVAMLGRFEGALRDRGSWVYRRLHWETGIVGQVLYLEAEAMGVRSTGIGCFFDDPTHVTLGMQDRRYQTLYHFTVGGHVNDPRLTTLPPYSEERRPSAN